MASRFIESLNAKHSSEPFDLKEAQRIVLELIEDLSKRIFGQEKMIKRVICAQVIGKHVLIEGMPGEAKTTCVSAFAKSVGLRFRRVQFVPDMLPSDLIGSRQLQLDKKTGQPDLVFKDGPLCAPIVVADEINRAPAKVQAAMLEVMAEKQISRIDKEESSTPYHPQDRAELITMRKSHPYCFGVPLPDPDDRDKVPQVVFATQNPVEQEGTYSLSEASTDRFTFKVVITPPSVAYYTQIAKINIFSGFSSIDKKSAKAAAANGHAAAPALAGPTGEGGLAVATAPAGTMLVEAPPQDPMPLWLKTVSFFQGIRDTIFNEKEGMLQHVFDKKQGLWDRVRLVIMLTHYINSEGDIILTSDGGDLPGSLRPIHQDRMRRLLADWNRSGGAHTEKIRRDVDAMLTKPIFNYVDRGSSPRGLIDWLMASVADAYLDGSLVVKRRHFRGAAIDVLRHRVSLSPQAAANRIQSPDFINVLVQTLLPDSDTEEKEDLQPLLPQWA